MPINLITFDMHETMWYQSEFELFKDLWPITQRA